jgi:DNA invertase Pin-like site-specific DNA recombinase
MSEIAAYIRVSTEQQKERAVTRTPVSISTSSPIPAVVNAISQKKADHQGYDDID